jgi:Domain of unknown function (DUF4419)
MSNPANQESLRGVFVAHPGKEELRSFDDSFDDILAGFARQIQAKVRTPWVMEFIEPRFNTSRKDDTITSYVMMMGLMRGYFSYTAEIICGIPSVTLQGEPSDWKRLLRKTERLREFGEQPTEYDRRLRPVLERFVLSVGEPTSRRVREFWRRPVFAEPVEDGICGPPPPCTLSGWAYAFQHWDGKGLPLDRGDVQWTERFRPCRGGASFRIGTGSRS